MMESSGKTTESAGKTVKSNDKMSENTNVNMVESRTQPTMPELTCQDQITITI